MPDQNMARLNGSIQDVATNRNDLYHKTDKRREGTIKVG
jgi:hypothetical protein